MCNSFIVNATPGWSSSPVRPRVASAWPSSASPRRPRPPAGAACRRGATRLTPSRQSDPLEPEAPRVLSEQSVPSSSPLSHTDKQRK